MCLGQEEPDPVAHDDGLPTFPATAANEEEKNEEEEMEGDFDDSEGSEEGEEDLCVSATLLGTEHFNKQDSIKVWFGFNLRALTLPVANDSLYKVPDKRNFCVTRETHMN